MLTILFAFSLIYKYLKKFCRLHETLEIEIFLSFSLFLRIDINLLFMYNTSIRGDIVKSKLSGFLENSLPKVKQLVKDLEKKFSYVSILGVDTIGMAYSVRRTGSSVSDSNWSDRGFVARIFNGHNYSEYSFNQLDHLDDIKQQIIKVVTKDIEIYKKSNIKFMAFPLIDENELKQEYYTDFEIDPFSISTKQKLEDLQKLVDIGLKKSKFFVDFRAILEEVSISKIFVSSKKELKQAILYTNSVLVCIGRKNEQIKYDFAGLSGLKGYEIVSETEGKIDQVANSVLELFEAERIIPGDYEVICDPAISGLIAHEAFGHGVEMDMFVKNRAKGAEYINKEIASDKVVMRDGALSADEVGTYLFDDEGTLGTDTLIIEKEILKSGISDLLSALKLNTVPTGNGRRQGFERKVYARMTNTFFETGNDELEDMIGSIKKGYLLIGYTSGMEDPKNWGIQCAITKGREIIDGKFTGKVVSPIMMTGYVPDMLKSISMVSKDHFELSGGGACGKGYKEFVKVSTGGSYIKAIARLS